MSAFVHVMSDTDYSVIQKYLDEEGVVLVSRSMADRLVEECGSPVDGLYLEGYDFGGDPDVWVDIVSSEEHMAVQEIRKKLNDQQLPTLRDDRELVGKSCVFDTNKTDSNLQMYDGQRCSVIQRLDEKSYDFNEVGTMWLIRMDDGEEIEAFADEVKAVI